MQKSIGMFGLGALVLASAGSAVAAGIPRIISTQGRLALADGTPMQGTVDMTFKIYPAGSGAYCFTETKNNVPLRGGLFSVAVGADTAGGIAAACDFTTACEMQIQVGTDEPMAPKLALTASPYAIAASRVGVLTADETNNRIGIDTLTPAEKLDVVGNARVSGALTTGSFTTAGALTAGAISAAGVVAAGSFTTTGALTAATVAVGGTLTADKVSISNQLTLNYRSGTNPACAKFVLARYWSEEYHPSCFCSTPAGWSTATPTCGSCGATAWTQAACVD